MSIERSQKALIRGPEQRRQNSEDIANYAEVYISSQVERFLAETISRIRSGAQSTGLSSEVMKTVQEDQNLFAALENIQTEVNQLGKQAEERIREITRMEEHISNPEDHSKKDYDRKIKLLMEDPNLDTGRVFCTVDTTGMQKMERNAIYDNLENWDGRRELHTRLIEENIKLAQALSERLKRENPRIPPPTIFALRGSPGAGKTTSLRRGHEMFRGILDDKGQPSGSLAPDVFKGPLKEEGNLSSAQVHSESTMLGRAVKRAVSNPDTSVVFDKLMNDHADIIEMIESAKKTDRKIAIMDIDVPLELSAVRVLGREKGGADPNINFEGVAEGFKGIRNNRGVLQEALYDNPQLVNGYVLMAFDKESRQSVEVAVWDEKAGKVKINEGRENLAKPIEKPEEEIERIKSTVITEEYIQYFIKTYFDEKSRQFAEKTAQNLRQYLGKTISAALDEKAQ